MNVLTNLLQEYIDQKEAEQASLAPDPWRLRLHLMPPTGFMNDPNGLCWFKGLWHVFFQYAPGSPEGGLKCWGHYTSPDLLHWTYWGTPLLPDQPFDCHGVYSGSAIVKDETLHLFFSGNLFLDAQPPRAFSVVHVTSQDGFHFSEKQVVISAQQYPSDCSCQIRDPKVWQENGDYRMVIGAQTTDGCGALLFYRSKDLEEWQFDALQQPATPFGYMWECPDIFSLDGQRYLSVSPQGIEPDGYRYQNVFQSVWAPMQTAPQFDYTEWDNGFDFYAPQTFLAPDGRRLLYAWMGMDALSGYQNATTAHGWQHAQTLPRVITAKDGKLYQMPVQELQALRKSEQRLDEPTALHLPAELHLTNPTGDPISLHIGTGLHFCYDHAAQEVSLSFSDDSGRGRSERKAHLPSLYDLRIWLDTSSVEIFLNDGASAFTTRFYPDTTAPIIAAEISPSAQLIGWELDPITVERGDLNAE